MPGAVPTCRTNVRSRRAAAVALAALGIAACGSRGAQHTATDTTASARASSPTVESSAPTGAPTTAPTSPPAIGSLLATGQPAPPIAEADLPLYEIDQTIDDVAGTFSAKMHLVYKNATNGPITTLPLALYANAALELGTPSGGSIEVTHAELDGGAPLFVVRERATLVTLRLPTALAQGDSVRLTLDYGGKLRVLPSDTNDMFSQALASLGSLTGSGASDYGLLAIGDGILTFACAYPVVAPYRDGEFDTHPPAKNGDLEYNGVARFKVRTVVPEGVSLVTNLVDAAPEPAGKNVVVRSEGSFVRDFVLVAGRSLERSTMQQGGVRITSIYNARDAKAGKEILVTAAAALASYEKRFGPYPYRELDVAEASLVGGAGGVEFSGMVLVAGMLYRPVEDSQSPLMAILKASSALGLGTDLGGGNGTGAASPFAMLDTMREFTVDHEVAHQWFAELVGNDAFRAPSLDEPAAQYLAGLAMEDRHGAPAAARAMNMNVKMNYALHRAFGGADGRVNRDTSSFRTGIEYAALVYGKAPYVYVALAKELGAEKLHEAMRAAIAEHRFEIVSVNQWVGSLDEALGGHSVVPKTFHRYFEETHGDEDLGVDASGDFVISSLFPPELAASLRETTASLGMTPMDLFRELLAPGGSGVAPLGQLLPP